MAGMVAEACQGRMAQHERFAGIQALRGIAACMVVVYHATIAWSQHNGGFVFRSWASGVDIFFVISGFVMAVSAGNKRPLEFIKGRLIRIVPLYWIMTAAAYIKIRFLTLHLNAENGFGALKIPASHVIRSLLFIPYVNTLGDVSPVLGQGWTLNCEMFFYALFAAVLVFKGDVIKVLVPAITVLAVIGTFQSGPVTSFVLNPILVEFAFGIMLGAWTQKITKFNSKLVLSGGVAGFACLCAIPFPSPVLRPLEWGMPSACVVLCAIRFEDKVRYPKWMLYLGDASYALYLSHTLVLIVVIRSFIDLRIASSESFAILACLLTSIGISACIHTFIEKPMPRTLKHYRAALGIASTKSMDGGALAGRDDPTYNRGQHRTGLRDTRRSVRFIPDS